METIHCVDIPDTLTKELFVKCIYDDYPPIRQAALKKLICDNLLSDTPLVDLWEVDWNKLKINMPSLSEEIYKYIIEYHTYQSGLKIFDTILSKGTYYVTYNRLCELLKSQFLDDNLRQSILEVIKKHTSEKTENLISKLFLQRADIPELGGIILHMLENSQDVAMLCTKFSIQDVTCKHIWNDEYLPKICNIIIPHMDMLSLLRIFELCEFNQQLKAVEENITTQIIALIDNADEAQSNDKNFYQQAVDIAELLPQQLGIKIFRILVQKHQYRYIDDYIYFICCNKDIYPELELKFIFQNVGENIGEAYHGIFNCIYTYSDNIDNIAKFINCLNENQYFVPALAKNYERAIPIIESLLWLIDEAYKKIEQLNKLNILPQPVEMPQSPYKKLINMCQKLIEKIYASLGNNGTACAEIALKFVFIWSRYQKVWNIHEPKFQQDFLNHLCKNDCLKAQKIQKTFCEICQIPLPERKHPKECSYDIDYIIAVLKLLDVKIND